MRGTTLASQVPADVGLFVEIRNAEDILTALTEPQVWSTLAELAGQPSRPEDAARWQEQIERTVRMSPREAIRLLFAGGAAFAGAGPRRSPDALVLCRPSNEVTIQQLLERWNARALPELGAPDAYHLRNNIAVIARDGVLYFGDLLPPDGMFRSAVGFLSQEPRASLANFEAYRRLLARVPEDPDGLLFARLSAATSRPAPDSASTSAPATPRRSLLPAGFGDPLLVALQRESSLLHLTVVSDFPPASQPCTHPSGETAPAENAALLSNLPESALAAWEGMVDYPAIGRRVEELPAQNPIRVALQTQARGESIEQLLATLAGPTVAALGALPVGGREADLPPMPVLGFIALARDPTLAEAEFSALIETAIAAYDVIALARGSAPLPRVVDVDLDGVPANRLDLTPMLDAGSRSLIGELHLSWAVQGGALIVATHEQWLRQMLAARTGAGNSLRGVVLLGRRPPAALARNVVVVQSGPIADVGQQWLDFVARRHPEALGEGWWRPRGMRGAPRLGITVEERSAQKQLRVTAVQPGQPSDGFLRVDDMIVGCAGKRFESERPMQEVLSALERRAHPGWFDVLVQRGETVLNVRVPMPSFDPIQALRRLVGIGRIVQRVIFQDDSQDVAGPRAFVTIELRTSETPLFTFTRPAATTASQPGSAPEPQPTDVVPAEVPASQPAQP